MKRRGFVPAAGALVAAPLLQAQKERIARVGILATASAPTADQWAQSPFRIKLSELGWVEGRNLKFERRHAASAPESPKAARELAAMKLDVIYATGSPSLRAAKQEIATTPIVMFTVGDPVASGWVKNLARPEGNVTGDAGFARDPGAKRASLLKEITPTLKTARALGITIPQSVLPRAERVIE